MSRVLRTPLIMHNSDQKMPILTRFLLLHRTLPIFFPSDGLLSHFSRQPFKTLLIFSLLGEKAGTRAATLSYLA